MLIFLLNLYFTSTDTLYVCIFPENIYSLEAMETSQFEKCLLPDEVNLRLVAQIKPRHVLPVEIQLHLNKNRRKFLEEYLISKLSGRITRSLNKFENKVTLYRYTLYMKMDHFYYCHLNCIETLKK